MDKRILEVEEKDIMPMVPIEVYEYISGISTQWTGKGVAVEMGCWLGGTTLSALSGLITAGYDKKYYCYDRWKATRGEVARAKKYGIELKQGEDILEMFTDNVLNMYSNIHIFKGEISESIKHYPGEPIELCFFDAPKKNPVFRQCVQALSPHWIPGVTVVGFLDYYQYMKFGGTQREQLKAPVRLIENNPDSFIEMKDFWPDASCAFFLYQGGQIYVD